MKRTDLATKIIGLTLFLALLAYVGFSALRSVNGRVVTADATLTTIRDTASASGVVVRDETVITSGMTYIDVSVTEGGKAAKGQVIAVAYASEDGLERAQREHELELQIIRVRAILDSLAPDTDIAGRDSAIKSATRELSGSVARRELGDIYTSSVKLSSLVFDGGSESVTSADLQALESELSSLQSRSGSAGKTEITAPESGIFSSILDGYEHLDAAFLESLSPDKIETALEDRRTAQGGIGKLVTSQTWYFAAVMDADDIDSLTVGESTRLEFGRYYGSPVLCEVTAISRGPDGKCAVVFSCDEALTSTIAMRVVTAEVVCMEYTGLRVPKDAVQTDEDGETFVYTVTGLQAEAKPVEIIYETAEFCLAALGGDPDSLRAGNTIIVKGSDLYDGKMLYLG